MPSPGNKPFGVAGVSVTTADMMADPGYQPTLRENLSLGIGKAHRNVVYSHYDYRNFSKGALIKTHGRVR